MLKKSALVLICLAMLAIVLIGCRSKETAGRLTPLKVGALSMMTVLPLHVAQQDGLFQGQGINVEIVPFRSQLDRDTALIDGQIDCIIEDIYSAPVLNKDADLIKVVAVSPVGSYMFAIIAAKDSAVNNLDDLKNVEIASSLGNIIEYVTDQMCLQSGLKLDQIKKASVSSMPLRLEMLNQGKIQAATFSRPLSDLAINGGARIICDDSQNSLLTSSIMVRTAVLESRPGDIKLFLKAWTRATENISANPAKYRPLLVNIASISSDLASKIDVPNFAKPRLPNQAEYQAKMNWNLEKQNITKSISFQNIVAKGFLP